MIAFRKKKKRLFFLQELMLIRSKRKSGIFLAMTGRPNNRKNAMRRKMCTAIIDVLGDN